MHLVSEATPTLPRPELLPAPGELTDDEKRHLLDLLPPFVVILYNDEVHTFDDVIKALLLCIPVLSSERAQQVTNEAHEQGRAVVISCPKETAELYTERLLSKGLTVTMEQAQ